MVPALSSLSQARRSWLGTPLPPKEASPDSAHLVGFALLCTLLSARLPRLAPRLNVDFLLLLPAVLAPCALAARACGIRTGPGTAAKRVGRERFMGQLVALLPQRHSVLRYVGQGVSFWA